MLRLRSGVELKRQKEEKNKVIETEEKKYLFFVVQNKLCADRFDDLKGSSVICRFCHWQWWLKTVSRHTTTVRHKSVCVCIEKNRIANLAFSADDADADIACAHEFRKEP